jgi:hypothetical protein
MLKQVIYILGYLNTASLIIPIGIGLYRRKAMTPALWMVWGALVIYLILFLISLLLSQFSDYVNSLIVNYLTSFFFGVPFVVAYWLAVPSGWRKPLIAALGAAGAAGLIIEAVAQDKANDVSIWSIPLQTVLDTFIALIFLHSLLRRTKVSLLTVPLFWITSAFLVTSVLGTVYDAFHHAMLTSSIDLLMLWLCFQLAVTILCNLLYAVGFNLAKVGRQDH